MVTCVDRKSRYLAASLRNVHQAQRVTQVTCPALKNLPLYSPTLDNGAEFARPSQILCKPEVVVE